MGGILGKGDNERPVIFHNFLFNSVQILTCYCFFSAIRPRRCGRPRIEIDTLIHERRREAGGVVVLIAGAVPVAIDEAVVRACTGPVPCDQVWLSAKNRYSAA